LPSSMSKSMPAFGWPKTKRPANFSRASVLPRQD
jgi:hypothetical protein